MTEDRKPPPTWTPTKSYRRPVGAAMGMASSGPRAHVNYNRLRGSVLEKLEFASFGGIEPSQRLKAIAWYEAQIAKHRARIETLRQSKKRDTP